MFSHNNKSSKKSSYKKYLLATNRSENHFRPLYYYLTGCLNFGFQWEHPLPSIVPHIYLHFFTPIPRVSHSITKKSWVPADVIKNMVKNVIKYMFSFGFLVVGNFCHIELCRLWGGWERCMSCAARLNNKCRIHFTLFTFDFKPPCLVGSILE